MKSYRKSPSEATPNLTKKEFSVLNKLRLKVKAFPTQAKYYISALLGELPLHGRERHSQSELDDRAEEIWQEFTNETT